MAELAVHTHSHLHTHALTHSHTHSLAGGAGGPPGSTRVDPLVSEQVGAGRALAALGESPRWAARFPAPLPALPQAGSARRRLPGPPPPAPGASLFCFPVGSSVCPASRREPDREARGPPQPMPAPRPMCAGAPQNRRPRSGRLFPSGLRWGPPRGPALPCRGGLGRETTVGNRGGHSGRQFPAPRPVAKEGLHRSRWRLGPARDSPAGAWGHGLRSHGCPPSVSRCRGLRLPSRPRPLAAPRGKRSSWGHRRCGVRSPAPVGPGCSLRGWLRAAKVVSQEGPQPTVRKMMHREGPCPPDLLGSRGRRCGAQGPPLTLCPSLGPDLQRDPQEGS